MIAIYKAKKTFKGTVVIGGKTIEWIARWSAAEGEYMCNVRKEGARTWTEACAYYTSDWQDAKQTLEDMAHTYALKLSYMGV